MSQPKGSIAVAIAVSAVIVISVTTVGYYQFVYCASNSCTNQTSTSSAAAACTPPRCVTILINFGAATLTTTAFTPDVAKLVVGVNNTFQFLNNDSQGGGVPHTATARTCPSVCPFDTGVLAFNASAGPYTITTPGTYPYYCVIHATTMVGTIVVVAGSGSPTNSSSSTTSTTSSKPPTNALAVSIPKGAGGNYSLAQGTSISGFSPGIATVVIGVNNTITWTNNDSSGHTVTSTQVPNGVPTFNSGILGPGETWTMTFTVPGTYQYDCSLHLWMKGEVIVKSG